MGTILSNETRRQNMAKDRQVDEKEVLKNKSNDNELDYISEEGKNKKRTAKEQFLKRKGFSEI